MLGNFGSPSVSLVGVTDRFAYQRKKAIIRPKGQTTAIKTEPKFFLRRHYRQPNHCTSITEYSATVLAHELVDVLGGI
jgi:hypothetical protein